MKVGLIRCKKMEEKCSSPHCFEEMRIREKGFKGIKGEIEIVGVSNCGGCQGDKMAEVAVQMIKSAQADTIVLSSCMKPGDCPFSEKKSEALVKRLSQGVSVVDHEVLFKRVDELVQAMPESEQKADESSNNHPPVDIEAILAELEKDAPVKKLGKELTIIYRTHH